jgi:hypothetical protein
MLALPQSATVIVAFCHYLEGESVAEYSRRECHYLLNLLENKHIRGCAPNDNTGNPRWNTLCTYWGRETPRRAQYRTS